MNLNVLKNYPANTADHLYFTFLSTIGLKRKTSLKYLWSKYSLHRNKETQMLIVYSWTGMDKLKAGVG